MAARGAKQLWRGLRVWRLVGDVIRKGLTDLGVLWEELRARERFKDRTSGSARDTCTELEVKNRLWFLYSLAKGRTGHYMYREARVGLHSHSLSHAV